MAERARLQQLCKQYKHLLPLGFKCGQSTPILREAIEKIRNQIKLEYL